MSLSGTSLVSAKIKWFIAFCMALVCTSSAPVLYGFTKADTGPMKEALNTVQKTAMESMGPISKEAKNSATKAVDNVKASGEVIKSTLVSNYSTASTLYQIMEPHKDSVDKYNYYLFQYGEWIKSVFRYVPTIVADSFSESQEKIELQSLGYKKWAALIGDSNTKEAVASIMAALMSNQKALKALGEVTGDDVGQVFGVIKQTSRARMGKLMESVKENADAMKSEINPNYRCANEVLVHLLVGKDMSSTKINQLKNKVASLKDTLIKVLKTMEGQEGDGAEVLISGLENRLQELSSQSGGLEPKC